MRKRLVLIFMGVFFSSLFVTYAQTVDILSLKLDEAAKKGNPEQIWKTVKFSITENALVNIRIDATAKDNGGKIADSLKIVLDSTDDFGWSTEKAWSGRELKGKMKTVTIEKALTAGEHKIDFYAEAAPTLNTIKIQSEKIEKEKPGRPTIKSVTYLEKIGIKVTWSEVLNAKLYEVHRSLSGGEYEKIAQLSVLTYLDVSVLEGNNYSYKVVAINDNVAGDFSEEYRIKNSEKIPPVVPVGLRVLKAMGNATLVWNKNKESDIAGYNIYKRATEESEFKKIDSTTKNEYSDTKVEVGKKYVYKITALDINENESENSQEIIANVKSGNFVPEGVCDVNPREFYPGDKITVYFSGKKSSQIRKFRQKMKTKNPEISMVPLKVLIHYGFNNWDSNLTIQDGAEPEMTYDEQTDCFLYNMEVPSYAKDVDFMFYDEYRNPDNNYSRDYILKVQKDDVKPGIPYDLKATPLNGAIFLEWTAPTDMDIAGFTVSRSLNPVLGWDAPDREIVKLTKDSFARDENAKPGVIYYYRVNAVDYSDNAGEPSAIISSSAISIGAQIKDVCVWEPMEPVLGSEVNIYYSPKYGVIKNPIKMMIKINNGIETKKMDMKYDRMLDAWYFSYKFINSISEINFSFTDGTRWDDNKKSEWKIKTIRDIIPPEKLKGLKFYLDNKSIILQWEQNKELDLEGYNIYRNGVLITKQPEKATTFTDNNLEEEITYNYKVVPVDYSKNDGIGMEIIAKTYKDAIIAPIVDYNVALSEGKPVKLMASLESASKWQMEIMNSYGKVIRVFTGKGFTIAQTWDLKDESGKIVTPGVYKYRVSILGSSEIMPKEITIIVVN